MNERISEPHGYQPSDDLLIDRGLDEAERYDRVIDDATARRASAQLHEGQASALYSLASCGAIDYEALDAEISRGREAPEVDERMKRLYRHLGSYAFHHAGRGPVEGWHQLTAEYDMGSESDRHNQPRVFIGCQASASNGHLHGRWLFAAQEADDLHDEVQDILSTSPVGGSDGYFVADTEYFAGYDLGQNPSIETITRVARGIEEHGASFARWLEHHGIDNLDQVERTYVDAYVGQFVNERAAAYDALTSAGVYEAIQMAWNQVGHDYRRYMVVDLDAFIRKHPGYKMIRDGDQGVYLFRDA